MGFINASSEGTRPALDRTPSARDHWKLAAGAAKGPARLQSLLRTRRDEKRAVVYQGRMKRARAAKAASNPLSPTPVNSPDSKFQDLPLDPEQIRPNDFVSSAQSSRERNSFHGSI